MGSSGVHIHWFALLAGSLVWSVAIVSLLISLYFLLQPRLHLLFTTEPRHYLEENGEYDESKVVPAYKFPAETIKEPNGVIDDWWSASSIAERASSIIDLVVAEEGGVLWNCKITWPPSLFLHSLECSVKSTVGDKSEIDETKGVWGSVWSHEVEEGNGTGDTGLSDIGLLGAWLEDSTGIVAIDLNLDVCVVLSIHGDIIVPED